MFIFKIALVFLGLFSFSTKGATGCEIKDVEFVRNYDGDTITVSIKNIIPLFGEKIPVRVAGIDTAEIRGKTDCERKAAIMARDEVARLLKSAKVINLQNPKRDKYFRIVADVEIDGESLSAFLLNKGLAVSYDGGTKKDVDWCGVSH